MKIKKITTEYTEKHGGAIFCRNRRFFSCWFVVKFLLIFFVFSAPLFAQTQGYPWWLSLERGKNQFRSGEFGMALISFEDARRTRRAMYEQMERDLINLLSLGEVRRIGDSLERVERFAQERSYTAASAALAELFYRFPKTSFNNSATAALGAFDKLKNYPEAEFWIGEVYRVEGETGLALTQYQRALASRDILEDRGFAVTLQYRIATMHRIGARPSYVEMERTLISIIEERDTLWINAQNAAGNADPASANIPYEQASSAFARNAMRHTLTEHGINRFLLMYRYNNSVTEQAHRLLGYFYTARRNNNLAQQHLMFAFLIHNTTIIEEVQRHMYEYRFSNLTALMREIPRYPLLQTYLEEVEYFKTAYYFAASLFGNGNRAIARELWTFLASQPQAGEWQGRAASQLANPRFEQLVEMP
ncbi:MAG: hypothetical protein FWC01_03835 [Treponema sp.]|nr:hypothetical protein [Treponema sp.]